MQPCIIILIYLLVRGYSLVWLFYFALWVIYSLNWLLTKWSAKFRIGVYTWELHVYWVLSFIVCICVQWWIVQIYLVFVCYFTKCLLPSQNKFYPETKTIYLPNPSWPNHNPVFKQSGLDVTIATTRTCMHVELIASLGFKQLLSNTCWPL